MQLKHHHIVAVTFIFSALLLSGAHSPLAAGDSKKDVDLMSVWRELFARPKSIPAPADNPISKEKTALGVLLFSDGRLSGDGTRSCSNCHQPDLGFGDGRRTALGLSGKALPRNTPSLWNLAWNKSFFWDGRVSSLEAQVGVPLTHPDEMAGDWDHVVSILNKDSTMVRSFARAFPQVQGINRASIERAIATYQRTLVSSETSFDRFISGDEDALSSDERAGFDLFVGSAGCVACHVGWRFTDDRFHDIGLPSDDPGRGAVDGGVPGLRAFKTPSLRELSYTAPYMHDGSLASLEDVLDHYIDGIIERPGISANLTRPLSLTAEERKNLIAFLKSLSSVVTKK